MAFIILSGLRSQVTVISKNLLKSQWHPPSPLFAYFLISVLVSDVPNGVPIVGRFNLQRRSTRLRRIFATVANKGIGPNERSDTTSSRAKDDTMMLPV